MTRTLGVFGCALALALSFAGSASADAAGSTAMLRQAASTLITAELTGDGATACSKLYAPLTATIDGRTCVQRWDARSRRLLAAKGGARRLRADLRAVASAPITMDGLYATIALPHPLLDGQTRWYWTANCWMLMG
jgi:hypothetical protein